MGSGPVEETVRADVDALGDLEGIQSSLAQTAYTLARSLDEGAGMATAAVARELRATLEALMGACDDSDSTAELIARMSAPVGHAAQPKKGDARPKGRGGS